MLRIGFPVAKSLQASLFMGSSYSSITRHALFPTQAPLATMHGANAGRTPAHTYTCCICPHIPFSAAADCPSQRSTRTACPGAFAEHCALLRRQCPRLSPGRSCQQAPACSPPPSGPHASAASPRYQRSKIRNALLPRGD